MFPYLFNMAIGVLGAGVAGWHLREAFDAYEARKAEARRAARGYSKVTLEGPAEAIADAQAFLRTKVDRLNYAPTMPDVLDGEDGGEWFIAGPCPPALAVLAVAAHIAVVSGAMEAHEFLIGDSDILHLQEEHADQLMAAITTRWGVLRTTGWVPAQLGAEGAEQFTVVSALA